MLIGTVFMGGVRKFKSQQIQSKFYVFGGPIALLYAHKELLLKS